MSPLRMCADGNSLINRDNVATTMQTDARARCPKDQARSLSTNSSNADIGSPISLMTSKDATTRQNWPTLPPIYSRPPVN